MRIVHSFTTGSLKCCATVPLKSVTELHLHSLKEQSHSILTADFFHHRASPSPIRSTQEIFRFFFTFAEIFLFKIDALVYKSLGRQ